MNQVQQKINKIEQEYFFSQQSNKSALDDPHLHEWAPPDRPSMINILFMLIIKLYILHCVILNHLLCITLFNFRFGWTRHLSRYCRTARIRTASFTTRRRQPTITIRPVKKERFGPDIFVLIFLLLVCSVCNTCLPSPPSPFLLALVTSYSFVLVAVFFIYNIHIIVCLSDKTRFRLLDKVTSLDTLHRESVFVIPSYLPSDYKKVIEIMFFIFMFVM